MSTAPRRYASPRLRGSGSGVRGSLTAGICGPRTPSPGPRMCSHLDAARVGVKSESHRNVQRLGE